MAQADGNLILRKHEPADVPGGPIRITTEQEIFAIRYPPSILI
jgi:hypothetical protein